MLSILKKFSTIELSRMAQSFYNELSEIRYVKTIVRSDDFQELLQFYNIKCFKDLILAEPDSLKKLSLKQVDINLVNGLGQRFLNVYRNHRRKQLFSNWAKKLNIKVCPYCGANFTRTTSRSNNYRLRFEVDHFHPKNKHPFLALSFFNLIPCCSSCNRLKGTEDFNYNPYSLYENQDSVSFQFDDLALVRYLIGEDDIHLLRTELQSDNQTFREQLVHLEIEEVYNENIYELNDLLNKARYITQLYKKSIVELIPRYIGISEFRSYILGFSGEEKDFLTIPLAKWKVDLVKELDLD